MMGAVAEVLSLALDVIEDPECWCKGAPHRSTGTVQIGVGAYNGDALYLEDQHCAIGALEMAVSMATGLDIWSWGLPQAERRDDWIDLYRQSTYLLDGAARALSDKRTIVNLNDAPESTHEDVVLAFKHAYETALDEDM